MKRTARNPKTGERLVLKDGVWKPARGPVPWWHWAIVAGSAQEDRLRREQEPGWGRARDTTPNPADVEPKSWKD